METANLLTRMLNISPILSAISFKFICNSGLRSIATSNCGPSMRTIETKVDDHSYKAIKSICRACPNLRSLMLTSSVASIEGDEIIQTVAQHCPFMESILTEHWILSNAGMDALANMHNLKDLDLSLHNCPIAPIRRILQSNPQLTLLHVYREAIDDALVRCIGNYCRNLKRLDLHQGRGYSSFTSTNSLCDLFRGCPLLESFRLYQRGVVSNVALRALFEHCPSLTELDLSLYSPTPAAVLDNQPVLYTNYPSLTKLNVDSGDISGAALQDVFTYCTSLREVGLTSCTSLTDDTVKLMAQSCSRLTVLDLMGCNSITITGILTVATTCTSLSKLTLVGMPISNEVLLQLALNCPSLKSLSMGHCKGDLITEASILTLVEGCPGLTLLGIHGNIVEPFTPLLKCMQRREVYTHIAFDLREGV